MEQPAANRSTFNLQPLRTMFGERLRYGVSLARYTAARVGGRADGFLTVDTSDQLVEAASKLWEIGIPFLILGGGSNLLVSDAGVRGVVVHNRARRVRFDERASPIMVWAESGANLGLIARQAAVHGLAGLEWAAGIPGTVGGALVGNAGAHDGDMSGNLLMAEILHQEAKTSNGSKNPQQVKREHWPVQRMEYGYRTSTLKRKAGPADQMTGLSNQPRDIVLSASLRLERSTPEQVKMKIEEFVAFRHRSQPPGASMGSMFKNPLGDHAGRLIEAAGLKGSRVGRAEISTLHANFFINNGGASAEDIASLIRLARREVAKQFGVSLELEIEFVGGWEVEKWL